MRNFGSEGKNNKTNGSKIQKCVPEVISARLLTKSRARNDADASCLQQLKCIEHISWLTRLLGCCYGLLWELDLGKCIHGALDSVTGDTLQ